LRAAAVIAVAAYDHYFTSKFCDVLSSYGKPKKISKVDVGSRISEVKLFVETSERIINEWVKSKKLPSVSSVSD